MSIALDATLGPGAPPPAHDPSLAPTLALGSTPGATSASVGARPDATIDPARYVILRELARGGMGRVSIARDTCLGREVAIKELIEPHGELAGRFRRELGLTARLQHPSIVSVHDGGLWTTGELVYVMRLVSGASLDAVIARTPASERIALLPHAIAAVDALAYAHAQGIVHRDLKPANILVGDFGETVVIDWGIAKDLAELEPAMPAVTSAVTSDVETVAGAILGTPAYMPPEQAAGDPVDGRADVYALGAVLYHLLAGAPPYAGRSTVGVLAAVLAGPPPALATRAPGLPGDLLAIVDKAMARDPDARYATAQALAIDLKRFQSGQLVAAHRYSTWQLVRRWIRRQRTAVAVAAIALLVVIVGGVASIARILREEERATAASALAEDSRRDAEHLLDFMLVDLRTSLQPLGKLDLLGKVATEAAAYYERRPAGGDDDRHRRILSRHNLGEVLETKGDLRGALREQRASLALAEGLVARDPANAAWQLDLAASLRAVGDLETDAADLPAAGKHASAGLDIARRLSDGGEAWSHELVLDERVVARVESKTGDTAAAIAGYRRALAVATSHATPQAERDAMISREALGIALRDTDDLTGALAELREGAAIAERLAARAPLDTTAAMDVALAHVRLGSVLKKQHDVDGALAEYRLGLAIDEQLVARDPLNAVWEDTLAIDRNRVSKLLLEKKDFAGALAGYRATLAIRVRLAAQDPDNAIAQRALAVNHYDVGDVLEDAGDFAGAIVEYRAASAIADILAARDPSNVDWQAMAKELRDTVATCCTKK